MDHPIAYLDIVPEPVRIGSFLVGIFCLYRGSESHRAPRIPTDEAMAIDALAAIDVDQRLVICLPMKSLPDRMAKRTAYEIVWSWLYPRERFPLRPFEAIVMPYLYSNQVTRTGRGDTCVPLPILPFLLDALGFGEYVEFATRKAIQTLDAVIAQNSHQLSKVVPEIMLNVYARQLEINLARWKEFSELELRDVEEELNRENVSLFRQALETDEEPCQGEQSESSPLQ